MTSVPLARFCQARSGDKADVCNIAVFAPTAETYRLLVEQLTAERVKSHLASLVKGEVLRYEATNVRGLNFVCRGALGGGGTNSLQLDTLGKTYGMNVLRMEIDVPDELLASLPDPRDARR